MPGTYGANQQKICGGGGGLNWAPEVTEWLACKVAPTIAGSTNETKTEVTEMLACKVAPTTADSTNKTKSADNMNETIKVPDNVYAEVCTILAALRTLADAVLLGRATRSGGTGQHHGRPPRLSGRTLQGSAQDDGLQAWGHVLWGSNQEPVGERRRC